MRPALQIIWPNMTKRNWNTSLRRGLITVAFYALLIFYLVPVSGAPSARPITFSSFRLAPDPIDTQRPLHQTAHLAPSPVSPLPSPSPFSSLPPSSLHIHSSPPLFSSPFRLASPLYPSPFPVSCLPSPLPLLPLSSHTSSPPSIPAGHLRPSLPGHGPLGQGGVCRSEEHPRLPRPRVPRPGVPAGPRDAHLPRNPAATPQVVGEARGRTVGRGG